MENMKNTTVGFAEQSLAIQTCVTSHAFLFVTRSSSLEAILLLPQHRTDSGAARTPAPSFGSHLGRANHNPVTAHPGNRPQQPRATESAAGFKQKCNKTGHVFWSRNSVFIFIRKLINCPGLWSILFFCLFMSFKLPAPPKNAYTAYLDACPQKSVAFYQLFPLIMLGYQLDTGLKNYQLKKLALWVRIKISLPVELK